MSADPEKHDYTLGENQAHGDNHAEETSENAESGAESAEKSALDETESATAAATAAAAAADDRDEQFNAMREQMLRALAETDNIRKRSAREREDARKYSISGFAKDLLDVADNLRRAIDSFPDNTPENDVRLINVMEGIQATERELLRAFEKHGLKKLEPELEETFDPNIHEVMFEAPVPGKINGQIMQVVDTGYMLHDRLLRPARVGVVKNPESSGPQTPPTNDQGQGGHIDTKA